MALCITSHHFALPERAVNFLNLTSLSLSHLHLCARRLETKTDMHSHQLRPPIKQETREAKFDLTEEGSQEQRGKAE